MTLEGDRLDNSPEWVGISEAARMSRVSEKTIRRRIKAGEIEAKLEAGRYSIQVESLAPPPEPGREVVPIEILNRLDALRADLMAAEVARERATLIADFQTQRAATEAERRLQAEAERDKLMQEVETLRARRWWKRR